MRTATVRVFDDEPSGAFESLGEVSALADARYESMIRSAGERAQRRLRKAAAELGADAVIVTGRRVVEINHDPMEQRITPSFEGESRDRLRPGDPDATTGRRIWRTHLVGTAIKTGA